jgi:lipoate-protein ligase A
MVGRVEAGPMTALADREWRLIPEASRPGPVNMALDEVAAETVAAGGPRTVRVYRWDPSTLSLGYGQDPETIDWAYCERAGVEVTRRPTGGGAIYHDNYGDISYSIVAPTAELPGPLLACYEQLCEPVFEGLRRMGLEADFADDEAPAIYEPACYLRPLHPAHDVVAADGRKLSGNAQYRQRDAVVQHGSITYERLASRHCEVFDESLDPDTFADRVTSIREQSAIDRPAAVDALESALADWAKAAEGAWTDAELDRARELAAAKYEDDGWIRRGEDPEPAVRDGEDR